MLNDLKGIHNPTLRERLGKSIVKKVYWHESEIWDGKFKKKPEEAGKK